MKPHKIPVGDWKFAFTTAITALPYDFYRMAEVNNEPAKESSFCSSNRADIN